MTYSWLIRQWKRATIQRRSHMYLTQSGRDTMISEHAISVLRRRPKLTAKRLVLKWGDQAEEAVYGMTLPGDIANILLQAIKDYRLLKEEGIKVTYEIA
jgi:hypothetical protein